MPAPYSQDLRERVIGFMALGGSARAAAGRVYLSEHRARVLQLVAQQPDLTLQEIRSALAAWGITVGLSTVYRYLSAQNLTLKKRPCTRPSRTAPMSPRPGACSSAASQRS